MCLRADDFAFPDEVLSGAVVDYLEVFQDMSQSADRAWEQAM